MILTCNSCGKKFVVPDSAITSSGRMVQCGSCGNKWRQFPTGEIKTNQPIATSAKIIPKPKKIEAGSRFRDSTNRNLSQTFFTFHSAYNIDMQHSIVGGRRQNFLRWMESIHPLFVFYPANSTLHRYLFRQYLLLFVVWFHREGPSTNILLLSPQFLFLQ